MGPACSADTRIEGPIAGYVFDAPSASVRALTGAPGAAWLSAAVASGCEAVWMGPGGRLGLVLKGGALGLAKFSNDPPAFAVLDPTGGGIDQAAWAPDGQAAVLYSSTLNTLRLVTGLPDNPALGPQISLSHTGGAVSRLRLSEGGRHIALVVDHGARHTLYVMRSSGAPLRAATVADAGAIEFSSDGQGLYAVDRTANRLLYIPLAAPEDAQTVPLADPTAAPASFGSLLASRDGKLLFATLTDAAGGVMAIQIAGWNTLFHTSLEFAPASLERLAGSLYILVSSRERKSPIWLLDGGTGNVYFVPAGELAE
jgi:hypothetical protein